MKPCMITSCSDSGVKFKYAEVFIGRRSQEANLYQKHRDSSEYGISRQQDKRVQRFTASIAVKYTCMYQNASVHPRSHVNAVVVVTTTSRYVNFGTPSTMTLCTIMAIKGDHNCGSGGHSCGKVVQLV